MTIRLKTESRVCLLDSTQPGSLVHDVLAGAPVITRLATRRVVFTKKTAVTQTARSS